MQSTQKNSLYLILFALIAIRVFTMIVFPLTDTTEARYAHTAYLMASTNDWITPYFDKGIPFWGKPPLSFWTEALSYKIFGFYDFAPRIPSLIFTILTMMLIMKFLKTFYTEVTALWGGIVYFTFLLSFALSGVVITDPFLAFATTLTMIAFIMIIQAQPKYWGYLFFLGLALGLLAKGPLALVINIGSIVLWILFDFRARVRLLKELPWFRGIAIVVLLSFPWYIIAELKTPGFLDYFIVGEHFKRFLYSGWSGDLYGSAHKYPYGAIWFMWLQASFPWALLVIYILFKNLSSKSKASDTLRVFTNNTVLSYFLVHSLFILLFFTLSGNILMTYILPALAPLAVLIAIYLKKIDFSIQYKKINTLWIYTFFVPVVILILGVFASLNTHKLNTQKFIIEHYESVAKEGEKLYYIDSINFSSKYYSKDRAISVITGETNRMQNAESISFEEFELMLNDTSKKKFIVIYKKDLKRIEKLINRPMQEVSKNYKTILFEI